MRATINCAEYEYVAEPTDGVNLTGGGAWWGVNVRYRAVGARKWQRFNLVDVHSWDSEAITAAIDFQVTP
jgi:hypothetical protein